MPSDNREALAKFYENLRKNRASAIVAPTSYGKTLYSPILLKRSREDNLSYGLIHVTPFRALVREIHLEKFAEYRDEFSIGYQSMDILKEGEDKSPFFLRDLVATTLDSYVWNAFGIPVAEFDKIVRDISLGHGYVAGMSIFTSTIVFDEAHIFIGSSTERAVFTMVQASIAYLSHMNVPFAIETATIPSTKLSTLIKIISEKSLPLVYVCWSSDCGRSPQASNYKALLGNNFHPVADKEWYDSKIFKWKTYLIKENEVSGKVAEICRSKPVLIIRNTIPAAVKTFIELKETCPQAILIHGWMGARDRERKIKAYKNMLEARRSGVIVATQVIEAGVEAEALALVTDIAPIDNLAQRAGRLCRKNTEHVCREDGIDVYIIEDGVYRGVYNERVVEKTLEKLIKYLSVSIDSIDWRLLEDPEEGSGKRKHSFTKIIEEVHQEAKVSYGGLTSAYALFNALSLDLPARSMLSILETALGEELSETTLIKVVPGEDEDNFMVVELNRLIELLEKKPGLRGKCLKTSGVNSLVFRVKTSAGEEDVSIELRKRMSQIDLLRTLYYNNSRREKGEGHSIRDFYMLLREECYDSEIGGLYNVILR
jgi:CRISPR-associated endonuclease/helicase Cas3